MAQTCLIQAMGRDSDCGSRDQPSPCGSQAGSVSNGDSVFQSSKAPRDGSVRRAAQGRHASADSATVPLCLHVKDVQCRCHAEGAPELGEVPGDDVLESVWRLLCFS